MVAIGLGLLYLLIEATNNREMYEHNYARLFTVNVVVAGILFGVILWVAYRLLVRLREGRFGSRLLLKLATIFGWLGWRQAFWFLASRTSLSLDPLKPGLT
jgi:nitrogen fixation/metabolism regulation signal transduction histidine kinase